MRLAGAGDVSRQGFYVEENISRFAHGWLLLRMCVLAFFKLKVVD